MKGQKDSKRSQTRANVDWRVTEEPYWISSHYYENIIQCTEYKDAEWGKREKPAVHSNLAKSTVRLGLKGFIPNVSATVSN